MRNNKGQFIKGYDKDRGEFKKGHPSYVTEEMIKNLRKKMKKNNPMHNLKHKKTYLKSMQEKVWHNLKRNKKISNNKKGKKLTKEHINNLRLSHLGKKNSEKSKIKNSIKQTNLMKIPRNRKMRRVARQNQIILNGGGPSIGRNETEILDSLSMELKINIIRQKRVIGYWIDGYIPKLKLAIEVDERPKTNKRDIIRQKEIQQELKCKFLRVEDS